MTYTPPTTDLGGAFFFASTPHPAELVAREGSNCQRRPESRVVKGSERLNESPEHLVDVHCDSNHLLYQGLIESMISKTPALALELCRALWSLDSGGPLNFEPDADIIGSYWPGTQALAFYATA